MYEKQSLCQVLEAATNSSSLDSYWKLACSIIEAYLHPTSHTIYSTVSHQTTHPASHTTSHSVPLPISHSTFNSHNCKHDLNLSPNLFTQLLTQHLMQALNQTQHLTQTLTQLERSILEACVYPISYQTFYSPKLLTQPHTLHTSSKL